MHCSYHGDKHGSKLCCCEEGYGGNKGHLYRKINSTFRQNLVADFVSCEVLKWQVFVF